MEINDSGLTANRRESLTRPHYSQISFNQMVVNDCTRL